MFDIVRQLTALRSQMENHKTIEEQMNIAMLHTARPYKYAYINILWVFAYFNCQAPPPFSIRSQYIFEGINQLQSAASLLAQNTCHTSCKCQTHVEGANTGKQYEKLMKTQYENKSESKRSKTCETQTGNMPRSEKNLCRTLPKTRKSEQRKEGKDGEVCVTSDSFYTQMTWQHLLRQSGEFSTLPKYLPEACSRWS